MFDLRLLRDIALAIFLAVPTVALARPQSIPQNASPAIQPLVEQAAMADRTTAERRFALPG